MKKMSRLTLISLTTALILGSSLTACTRSKPADEFASSAPAAPSVPAHVTAPDPSTLDSKKDVQPVEINSDAFRASIAVHNIAGRYFYSIEGTISADSFSSLRAKVSALPKAEQNKILSNEIEKVFTEMKKIGAIGLEKEPELAFFSALIPYGTDLLAPLKKLRLNHAVVINPILFDKNTVKNVQAFRTEIAPSKGGARSNTAGYSGLDVMHTPGFVKLAQEAIGGDTAVDGSSVNLGITDTGITYNHPTFRSAKDKSKNRISYMKDFTGEGAIYFDKDQKITIEKGEGANEVLISANVIATPRLPALPIADKAIPVQKLSLTLSEELKTILLSENAGGAKFGILSEDSLNADADPVDLNANGKQDDLIPVILIPGATPADDAVYIDSSATGDFSEVKALKNWNATRDSQEIFAERVGVVMVDADIPNSDGQTKKTVRAVSIVGYDPGNHGSHVAGIASGMKTIANDSNETLARGAAPEASILMNRVCSNNAGCNATRALIDMAMRGNAEVINMSLGGLNPFNDGYGVQETIINRLTVLKNVLFVVSAGNSGPGKQTLGSPSTARLTMSVGATATRAMIERQYQWPGMGASTSKDDPNADFMLFFSSRGPTANGGFKPNITGPGTELSSVHLNASPGAEAGLAVYWGTSMSAPSVTGAYALFLDAIKKYNIAHPESKLPTDVLTLRTVLIASARPFDVNSYDPSTGKKSNGQYTWIDQGTGMIDLESAWKKLIEVRDLTPPTAVVRDGKTPVELDYEIVTSQKGPNGIAYDGSRAGLRSIPQQGITGQPAFGKGLYLDARDTDQLRQVHILRRLPENLQIADDAADLTRQMLTSADNFELKTVYYGSDQEWLKVGVKGQLDCMSSDTADLNVVGKGADIEVHGDDTGKIVEDKASTLNVCIDRRTVLSKLKPGDHGALIYAYRKVGDQISPAPAFIVPVYMTVPNQTLANSNGYEINETVPSFGVKRNYVVVPEGTSVVKVTLEAPKTKTDPSGLLSEGEFCSGVELMAYQGVNTDTFFKTRPEARVTNCDPVTGAPSDKQLSISFTQTNPTPGIWDIHVFGRYQYALSNYKLRVDYISGTPSVESIKGDLAALNGKLIWTLAGASVPTSPSGAKSSFELNGLSITTKATINQDQNLAIENPLGKARSYPLGTGSVTITTGGSKGNDIDLTAFECDVADAQDPSCTPVAQSGGSTDEEEVSFEPKPGKFYAAVAAGYDIKGGSTSFTSTETIQMAEMAGSVGVSGSAPAYDISYNISSDVLNGANSLALSTLFTEKGYSITGSLVIKTDDKLVLDSVPVEIKK